MLYIFTKSRQFDGSIYNIDQLNNKNELTMNEEKQYQMTV